MIKRLQSNSQGKVVTFPIVFPKLYKYRPLSKYAVADLKGQRMTATSIGCFNDLFDGAIHLYGTKEERRVASEQKWRDLQASLQKIGLSPEIVSHEPFVNTYESMFEEEERLKFRALEFLGTYVVCLSTKKDSILMWSHYADSQQGICIEYDLNQWDADSPQRKLLFPVLYTDEPVNTSELFDKDAYTISKYPVDEAVLCAAINKGDYNMNKILIIDDDKELCELLQRSVLVENINADVCHSGKDGIFLLSTKQYQLIVLDIMMPGLDGFETMERIREKSNIPILMLTAKSDSLSKVRGLRAGADDYLTKPFDVDEFVARVISLIRRSTQFSVIDDTFGQLVYKGLEINLDEHSVTTEKGTFELPHKEFELLLYLARNQGKILTKKQIYEAVWNEEYCFDDANIMVMISKLRKKIEPDSDKPSIIQTVKGMGYRFSKEV